jgi:hypothetical protein
MGSGVIEKGRMLSCDGNDVLKELKDTFEDPTSAKYRYARANNIFDQVPNAAGNYRDLVIAYLTAGVDVCAGWFDYLKALGTSAQGQQDIYDIAQTRYDALNQNVGIKTSTHDGHGGGGNGHVHSHHGHGGADPSTIDSPFPLPS